MRITIHIVIEVEDVSPEQHSAKPYIAQCPYCDWNRAYATQSKAKRGYAGHYPHCTGSKLDFDTLTSPR